MSLHSTGTISVHHGKKDVKRAEKLGIIDHQPSSEYSESLKHRVRFNEIASRAKELREKMRDGSLTLGDLTAFIQDIEEPPDF